MKYAKQLLLGCVQFWVLAAIAAWVGHIAFGAPKLSTGIFLIVFFACRASAYFDREAA